MSAIVKFEAITDLAARYGLGPEAFVQTMQQIAMPKPHTDPELVSCLLVAREHGLNPLTKEIYFMRDKHGNIQAIVGVDGWLRKINEHPQFDGMSFTSEMDDNGVAISMTCHMHRKDRTHPITITEYMSECRQKRSKPGPWDTHPNRMIRNRTICQTGRVAFGFAGVMEPDEFEQWQASETSDPIPLHVVSTIPPRDGGDLVIRGEARKRPASNAFKDTGGADKYNSLIADLNATETIADLHSCFDGFEKTGMPWADFPSGWARLVQDFYAHRLTELTTAEPETSEPEITGIDALSHAIESASSPDQLAQIFRDGFEAGTPWGGIDESDRDDIAALYDSRMDDLRGAA